jgi:hypothetical protein
METKKKRHIANKVLESLFEDFMSYFNILTVPDHVNFIIKK